MFVLWIYDYERQKVNVSHMKDHNVIICICTALADLPCPWIISLYKCLTLAFSWSSLGPTVLII